MDLERALDALAVARGEPGRALRVDRRELGVQSRPAFARAARVELGADVGVGDRERIEAVEQRLEVQHRAADEKRQRAARADRHVQGLLGGRW